jgi:hypothetical protein
MKELRYYIAIREFTEMHFLILTKFDCCLRNDQELATTNSNKVEKSILELKMAFNELAMRQVLAVLTISMANEIINCIFLILLQSSAIAQGLQIFLIFHLSYP